MYMLKRLVLLGLTGILLFTGWFLYHVNTAVHIPVAPYEFSIKSGSNLRSVASQLANAGVLPDAWSFILLSRVMGHASSLKAGDYKLSENTSPLRLLEYITEGDINQSEIKFIEGRTFRQMRKTLNEHPSIQHDTAKLSDQDILQLIGARETVAEGLFFPDTYYFVQGSSDTEILKQAYRVMQNNLASAWATATRDLPLENSYQALILASIIEKETGKDADRVTIAGVFINRLRSGMLLQTDPTIIYGLGEKFDGNLRKKDLQTDHEYNTYTRPGLPPTPISMPGLASIQAALNPAKTDALYFVAKGNGESHFSSNLPDHNRAVAKYQKRYK
ncbi:MAG: endolytic transglycosylase MltG [Betaproteobacteria bacterium]|nr:MAG: endolytic transglycosylase MltG [Betaproteobacteria bacterium]